MDSCQGRVPDITLECMQYIRQRFPAVMISVEVEKPARPGLQKLAAEANVVFYSKSWAQVASHDLPLNRSIYADPVIDSGKRL